MRTAPTAPDAGRQRTELAAPLTEAPDPPAPEPEVLSFLVLRQHVLGSCRGLLNVSPAGVSFVPEKGKDAFTLEYHQFLSALSEDSLTIKSETKTYRFKVAGAASTDETRSQLQAIMDAVARSRRN